MHTWKHRINQTVLPIVASGLLSGCTPSIAVLGAYFPDWLFCIIGGLLLTVTIRSQLIRTNKERVLGPPVFIYPMLLICCAILVWIVLF